MSKNVEEKAVELLDKLDNLVTQYAPEVYSTAVDVVRMSGINSLVWGILGAIFIATAFLIAVRITRMILRDEEPTEIEGGFIAVGVITGLFLSISGLIHVTNLFKLWNWVAVFDPELALARKVLGL